MTPLQRWYIQAKLDNPMLTFDQLVDMYREEKRVEREATAKAFSDLADERISKIREVLSACNEAFRADIIGGDEGKVLSSLEERIEELNGWILKTKAGTEKTKEDLAALGREKQELYEELAKKLREPPPRPAQYIPRGWEKL